MSGKKTHILGTTGKILGWIIVAAIAVVATLTGIWILFGAALIMIVGLWAGEGRRVEDRSS